MRAIRGEAGILRVPPVPRGWGLAGQAGMEGALLDDVPGVHLRDIVAVWIWNLLLLLHRQGGRLCWLRLLFLLLLPGGKLVTSGHPKGQAQGSQGTDTLLEASDAFFSYDPRALFLSRNASCLVSAPSFNHSVCDLYGFAFLAQSPDTSF